MPKFQLTEYGSLIVGGVQLAVLANAVAWSRMVMPLPLAGWSPPLAKKFGLRGAIFPADPDGPPPAWTFSVEPTCGGTARIPILSYSVS